MESLTDDKTREDDNKGGVPGSFFSRHSAEIWMAVLIAYVILLGIGTVAELFEIQSILDWWIFRSPGR